MQDSHTKAVQSRPISRPSELPEFFQRITQYQSEFMIYDDGFRGWTLRYTDVGRLAKSFAARLQSEGVRKGDAVAIWSESRPGWIVALWGCLLTGVVVIPIEPQSSLDWYRKIEQKVRPRLLLVGDRVPEISAACPVWRLRETEQDRFAGTLTPVQVLEDDVAEIVFTSGTTAEPKGVVITHRNLAAQIRPIEDQFGPYLKYVRPFAPLRILNLLPMSHLFGQSLATFVPPLIPASVLFISNTSPREIVRQIRSRRVAILVSVPRILEVLRDYIVHRFPATADSSRLSDAWPRRWWRYRAVHRMFGWKFCCVVSGGAPLPADLERFWSNLAFVVVQGYGLTETAPVISFNHPFHVHPGTTGQPMAGVDVRIASDGEVLVRGDIVTPGYFEDPEKTRAAFRDGWFHTGDFGELDAEGNLIIRGRKNEMIVTPEGLKVFPEDVERVLDQIPGVRESAVIGQDHVHAVLVLESGVKPDDVIYEANSKLEEHQKIRSFSIWPQEHLPRTKTTRKLRRAEIASVIASGAAQPALKPENELAGLVQKYAPGRAIGPETTIEELGLSSLDRVELMLDLEAKLNVTIDEGAFASASTVADLARSKPAAEETSFPRYSRRWFSRMIRGVVLEGILLPLTNLYARRRVSGLEHLRGLEGPVIFAANHESYIDTPVVLASLPWRMRRRIAPAMWKEYFDAHFHPERYSWFEGWTNSILYGLITVLFNGFPIPQTEMGAGESIRYMGELAEQGWSILIFPEGGRSPSGEIGRFLPGVGMIASHLHLPVIPIRIRGTGRVLPPGANWPRRGRVEVTIGAPIQLQGDSYPALALQVEDDVRRL